MYWAVGMEENTLVPQSSIYDGRVLHIRDRDFVDQINVALLLAVSDIIIRRSLINDGVLKSIIIKCCFLFPLSIYLFFLLNFTQCKA